MSMRLETCNSEQGRRDIRSEQADFKRDKDSRTKWSRGARPSAGCHFDWTEMEARGGSASQQAKMRPRPNSYQRKHPHNVTKLRSHWEAPHAHYRASLHAKEEIKESILSNSLFDLTLADAGGMQLSAPDDFKYSFDKPDSPNRPVTLGIFVRTTGRDTEKMVKKEYEILDVDGEALKGRKARQNLRKPSSETKAVLAPEDDFELV